MGNNPFISHRMFVAALNSDSHTQEQGGSSTHPGTSHVTTPPVNLSPEQLAALAAKHWLDFPYVRGIDHRAP